MEGRLDSNPFTWSNWRPLRLFPLQVSCFEVALERNYSGNGFVGSFTFIPGCRLLLLTCHSSSVTCFSNLPSRDATLNISYLCATEQKK